MAVFKEEEQRMMKNFQEVKEMLSPYLEKAKKFPIVEWVDLYVRDGRIVYAEGDGEIARIIREENRNVSEEDLRYSTLVPMLLVIA